MLYKQAPVFIGTAELIRATNQQADPIISAWKSAYRIPKYQPIISHNISLSQA